MKNLSDYSNEEFVRAMLEIKKEYPSVFIHFFLSRIDPEEYKKFMDSLGKINDS